MCGWREVMAVEYEALEHLYYDNRWNTRAIKCVSEAESAERIKVF